jgi:hypothetical protein
MAFSRFDTFCQYLEMPFLLSDFISHFIGFGARRGRFDKIHYTIRRRRRHLYSLCFVLYSLSRRLMCSLLFKIKEAQRYAPGFFYFSIG